MHLRIKLNLHCHRNLYLDLHHAASAALGYRNAVVITSDTDVFVILLYHVQVIKFTMHRGTGSGKQLINLSELHNL